MRFNQIIIKKTAATVIVFGIGTGVANASILAANTSYDMSIRTGTSCYSTGDCTQLLNGATDNGSLVNFNGNIYGSSIAGDGLAGIIRFQTDASGNNLTGISYNMDQYQDTPPDGFVTWNDTPELMMGTVDASGNMTFTPTGREGIAGFLTFLGIQPWNIDDSSSISTPSNQFVGLTTGTSTSGLITASPTESPISLTGQALTSDGNGGWNGLLVSASNFGENWTLYSGTPYTEVWDVNIQAVATVPVPAAAWLFGSGLLGLVGLARRKTS